MAKLLKGSDAKLKGLMDNSYGSQFPNDGCEKRFVSLFVIIIRSSE
jgi:hypothetical protein